MQALVEIKIIRPNNVISAQTCSQQDELSVTVCSGRRLLAGSKLSEEIRGLSVIL